VLPYAALEVLSAYELCGPALDLIKSPQNFLIPCIWTSGFGFSIQACD
jgi:hypothetical protein